MTEKIILSADEIEVIHQQLNGQIEVWSATEEQQKHLTSVINKAEALEQSYWEQDPDFDSGDDLIEWFWGKYKTQEGIK